MQFGHLIEMPPGWGRRVWQTQSTLEGFHIPFNLASRGKSWRAQLGIEQRLGYLTLPAATTTQIQTNDTKWMNGWMEISRSWHLASICDSASLALARASGSITSEAHSDCWHCSQPALIFQEGNWRKEANTFGQCCLYKEGEKKLLLTLYVFHDCTFFFQFVLFIFFPILPAVTKLQQLFLTGTGRKEGRIFLEPSARQVTAEELTEGRAI